ncbi:GxxExxY protein [Hymenobacter siberiensis]|jgi:GxxExxY protein|uniref:GxxExxY protein n=1 Tax=Hymenobacter siberiensis TaxID=2848396 RepID=UPI001C1E3404|nr:GxxExxY protein [Hymenobacter siberiensis]
MSENDISFNVRKAAFAVHTALGPGLLESSYEDAMLYELRRAGFAVQTQVGLPMIYAGQQLDIGYRIDMLVNRKVIVELKSVDSILDVHKEQLLTYLKLSKCKLGLLINLNVVHVKEGILRIVNGLEETLRTSA